MFARTEERMMLTEEGILKPTPTTSRSSRLATVGLMVGSALAASAVTYRVASSAPSRPLALQAAASASVTVSAYVDAMCPDCRRHALTLHEYMLSKSDVLGAIDLEVYYLGSNASVAEHGIILQSVNKYELCAENTLEQDEWWPYVHCMYGLQACLSRTSENATAMSCAEAESGSDDDLAIAGTDSSGLDACTCTLEGAAEYCAATHTSTNLAKLKSCVESEEASEWYEASNAVAVAQNDGFPLWVDVNGVTYSFSTNETVTGLAQWATSVLSVTCQAISASDTELPDSCSGYVYTPSVSAQ